jgi:hypothetical protein
MNVWASQLWRAANVPATFFTAAPIRSGAPLGSALKQSASKANSANANIAASRGKTEGDDDQAERAAAFVVKHRFEPREIEHCKIAEDADNKPQATEQQDKTHSHAFTPRAAGGKRDRHDAEDFADATDQKTTVQEKPNGTCHESRPNSSKYRIEQENA